jgi:restriction system protein
VEIQQFRGAMSGSDRGIYITTSWFTSDARKEAKKPDQRVIELIDGETLVDIFIDLKLGVRPTFEVDSNFFDLFAKEA